jgi:hypothetical protein
VGEIGVSSQKCAQDRLAETIVIDLRKEAKERIAPAVARRENAQVAID